MDVPRDPVCSKKREKNRYSNSFARHPALALSIEAIEIQRRLTVHQHLLIVLHRYHPAMAPDRFGWYRVLDRGADDLHELRIVEPCYRLTTDPPGPELSYSSRCRLSFTSSASQHPLTEAALFATPGSIRRNSGSMKSCTTVSCVQSSVIREVT